jgi:hypothetical protein
MKVKSRPNLKLHWRGEVREPGIAGSPLSIHLLLIENFAVYESAFERFNYAVTEQKKIFGTDGVRGVANVEPITAETALKLGRAAAYVFAQLNPRRSPAGARPKIVLYLFTELEVVGLVTSVGQNGIVCLVTPPGTLINLNDC